MLPPMSSNSASEAAKPASVLSRREFLATSSTAVLAGVVAPASTAAESDPAPKLALHGGEKAVKHSAKLPIRWGEPERERLNAMLGQDSLFYWKGPQATLLIE